MTSQLRDQNETPGTLEKKYPGVLDTPSSTYQNPSRNQRLVNLLDCWTICPVYYDVFWNGLNSKDAANDDAVISVS